MAQENIKILFKSFRGGNCLAIMDKSKVKQYANFFAEGPDWDLFPAKLAELKGSLAGHQINNFFLKYNADHSIQELIICSDGFYNPYGSIEDLDFNSYEQKVINGMKFYHDFSRVTNEAGSIEISSNKMSILCSFLEAKGNINCDNGTYLLNEIYYQPIKQILELDEVSFKFECCTTQRSLEKGMIRNLDKAWSTIHCDNCDKSIGGMNSKIKWHEQLYYKDININKNKFIVKGLENYFNINVTVICESISRKDGKSFGKKFKIGEFIGGYEESKLYKQ